MSSPITAHEQELDKKLSALKVDEVEAEAQQRAQELQIPYINLRFTPFEPEALAIVPEETARKAQLAVIRKNGKAIVIAVADPQNSETESVLSQLKKDGYTILLMLVSAQSLVIAWNRYQSRPTKDGEAEGTINLPASELAQIQEQIKNLGDLKEQLSKIPVSEILNSIIAGALKIGASDIHIEAEEKDIRLRYRLDGVLNDVVNFSPEGYPKLLSRIKIVSGLKLNIHNVPQDGRFTIRQPASALPERDGNDSDIEVRVSVLPGGFGEDIVMRILDPSSINQPLEKLGMRPDLLENVKRLLQKTTGAFVTSGPTGSGKTTTLYSFLRAINKPDVKIITIEDPIEYHLPGVAQTQVDARAGYTFSNGLRSIVRQDPDTILVGEIRDVETAEIAMQAALTGHQVFTTLHTNNAAGVIPRLIDLGVKPVTIAPAINAAMAQRLVRVLCPDCKKKEKIKDEDRKLLENNFTTGIPEEIFYPVGCDKCHEGYKGRIGVYELLEINPEMEKLIQSSPAISDVESLARKQGMVTLLQDGLIKVMDGVTSIEEVMRVIGI